MIRNIIGRAARLLVVLLIVCVQAGEIFPVQAQPSEAYALVEAVNTYRASVGLPRLDTSPALMVAAQRHVEWMASTYTYSHTGEGGSSPQSRATAAGFNGSVGENAGGSTNATPAEMIFFWDQSYAHRVTMRGARATHIGAGFAANDDQRLFILLIGTASGQSPQPAPPPVAGGTPVIGFTPPPNMVWSTNGELHQGSDYAPVPVNGQSATSDEGDSPAAVAYVMPFDMIRRAEPGADGSIVHLVESGQTAWAIAMRYGVDLQDILTLNHLGDSPFLKPGDRLIIRLGEGQSPPTAPPTPSTHTVQAGESLWTIAARYNRSVDELRTWNNLAIQDMIQPGMTLIIAPPTPLPTETAPPAPAMMPSPSLTSTGIPITYTALPTATPLPVVTALPPTVVAQVPTLVEITGRTTSPQQEAGLRLLLLLGSLGALAVIVWVAVVAYLARKSRR